MALIVGTIVGVGIFRTPSLVAGNAESASMVMLAWLAGGLVSLVGALCYAELATTYPHAGGDYHYLARAFGRRFGFLFAWARMTVIQTGSIALLAFVLGDYAAQLVPLGAYGFAIYAGATVALLTGLNVLGARPGSATQNLLIVVEMVGLLLLIVAGLWLVPAIPASTVILETRGGAGSAFGLVMVFVLLTYGGWSEAAYLSAEIREPHRNIARAFVASILVVTALYLLVNWTYLVGLGLSGMAQSTAVAADLMERALGPRGAQFVSLLIVVSALTSANAAIFTGARTAYAVGRDFPAFGALGRWHRRAGTPANALVLQGVIVLALIGLGALTRRGFETMVEYTAPVFWLFFLATGASLFVLRRRDRGTRRPFRVPLYPLTPLLFCATCAYLLYASLAYTGVGALVGVAVVAIGVLVLGLAGTPSDRHPVSPNGGS
ncbi:MAG: amino acid permease [Candidatus Rokubacteria bacterium]|nr:amino acid permease [Candidatus Rokubacteria bacterium]